MYYVFSLSTTKYSIRRLPYSYSLQNAMFFTLHAGFLCRHLHFHWDFWKECPNRLPQRISRRHPLFRTQRSRSNRVTSPRKRSVFICFEFLYLIIKSFIYALLGLQFKLFPFKFKYTFLNNGYIFKFVLYVFLYFIERLLIVYLIF